MHLSRTRFPESLVLFSVGSRVWGSPGCKGSCMRFASVGILVVSLVLAGCGSTSVNPATEPRAPLDSVPIRGVTYHGMWTSRDEADRIRILDQIAASGVGWVRMDVAWKDLQPQGRTAFDSEAVAALDSRLKEIANRGLKALVMFWWAPAWSSGGPEQSAVPGDPQDYAQAARWLVERWPSEIAALQVWNEPNLPEFFADPDPAVYARLLAVTYPAVKDVRPDLTVVTAAPTGLDLSWYRGFIAATDEDGFDAIGAHPYPVVGDMSTEECADQARTGCNIARFVAFLDRHGLTETPVWVTEFGWSTHADFRGMQRWQRGVDEEEQAKHTAAMLATFSQFPQIQAAFIYRDRDFTDANPHMNGFGVVRADGSVKPVFAVLNCSSAADCRARAGNSSEVL